MEQKEKNFRSGDFSLFKDVGSKIKIFSLVFFAIEFIGSIVGAVLLSNFLKTGVILLILVGAIVVSYLTALLLYGFGQLIENSDTIAKNTDPNQKPHSITEEDNE